jgi:hypothetical protein
VRQTIPQALLLQLIFNRLLVFVPATRLSSGRWFLDTKTAEGIDELVWVVGGGVLWLSRGRGNGGSAGNCGIGTLNSVVEVGSLLLELALGLLDLALPSLTVAGSLGLALLIIVGAVAAMRAVGAV